MNYELSASKEIQWNFKNKLEKNKSIVFWFIYPQTGIFAVLQCSFKSNFSTGFQKENEHDNSSVPCLSRVFCRPTRIVLSKVSIKQQSPLFMVKN